MYTLNYHSTLLPSVQKVYLGYGTEWVGSDGVIALAQTNATFYANYCFSFICTLENCITLFPILLQGPPQYFSTNGNKVIDLAMKGQFSRPSPCIPPNS